MTGLDVGLTLSLVLALASALGWYRSTVRNQRDRERDIAHVLREMDAHSRGFDLLHDDVDELGDRLSRLEILLIKQGRDA